MRTFEEMDAIVGSAEVAEAMGVSVSAVSNWQARGKMPKPGKQLAMGPLWETSRLIAWRDLKLKMDKKRMSILQESEEWKTMQGELERMCES